MKAIDTNILARFFVNDPDDPQAIKQQEIALNIMSQPVFISLTVILEFEWVMRGFYKLPRPQISQVFKALFGLSHVQIEDKSLLVNVLYQYEQGLDFADALHVAKAVHCQTFITFDQKLVKKAVAHIPDCVVELAE